MVFRYHFSLRRAYHFQGRIDHSIANPTSPDPATIKIKKIAWSTRMVIPLSSGRESARGFKTLIISNTRSPFLCSYPSSNVFGAVHDHDTGSFETRQELDPFSPHKRDIFQI